MTYQLVPLDNHRHNIAKKSIQFWKDQFISFLSGVAATVPSTSGARSSLRQKSNYFYYDNQTSKETFSRTLTYMVTMTNPQYLSSPSECRHSSMRSIAGRRLGMNTRSKYECSEPPTNTIAVGACGLKKRGKQEYQAWCFSNTNTFRTPPSPPPTPSFPR